MIKKVGMPHRQRDVGKAGEYFMLRQTDTDSGSVANDVPTLSSNETSSSELQLVLLCTTYRQIQIQAV